MDQAARRPMVTTMDKEWLELERLAQRKGPRYGREWGTCPVCGLGATMVANFATVTWGCCASCRLRWPVGVDMFDQWFGSSKKHGLRDAVYLLAEFDQLATPPRVAHQGQGQTVMKKERAIDAAFFVDPFPDFTKKPNGDPADASAAVPGWHGLTEATRQRVGALLVEGDPTGRRLGVWKRLQAKFTRAEDMAEGSDIVEALAGHYCADAQERDAWKRVATELQRAGFINHLPTIERKFSAGRGVLEMLREHRAAIDAQIAVLESRVLAR
jgi:hypothetical protein